MPSHFPAGKLLAFGAGISAVAVGQTLLGPGIPAALTGVGGSLLKILFAGEVRQFFSDDQPGPESLIQNDDLRQLVGEAIADTMRLSAGEGPGRAEAAPTIKRLADGAAELWNSAATAADADYSDFDEESVSELFTQDTANFNEVTALDQTTWRSFLETLNDTTEADAEFKLLDSLANRLHQSVAEMVRVKVKQDFSGNTSAQGRGFASLRETKVSSTVYGIQPYLFPENGT